MEAVQTCTTLHQLNTAVLFLIFNRLHTTKRVFEAIRQVKPLRFYIASDGHRPDRAGEDEKVQEVRNYVLNNIDWNCEVKTMFWEQNLGCKRAPSSAITWFFKQESEGIVLEDDCLPDPSFFPFCAELLERYRYDNRVFIISGTNELGTWKENLYSYFYTLGNTWGWASWRRAWQHFDLELKLWTSEIAQQNMRVLNQKAPHLVDEIITGCEAVLREGLDAWDYQWAFDRVVQGGLGVVPATNLVSNIGFGKNATHTIAYNSTFADKPVYTMQFPLRHNPDMHVDFEYYEQSYKTRLIPMMRRIKNRLKTFYRRFVYVNYIT